MHQLLRQVAQEHRDKHQEVVELYLGEPVAEDRYKVKYGYETNGILHIQPRRL
jgi:hypothetical protein